MAASYIDSKKAVVIGGGLSGLATAALLGKQGWNVTVLEKNATLGGRARTLTKRGFEFDMGPSWYLMPEVFERFFSLFNKKPSDFYKLVRLDPRYEVVFHDGQRMTLMDETKKNISEFEKIERGAGRKLQHLLHTMQRLYEVATTSLIYENIWSWRVWLKKGNMVAIGQVIRSIRLWESWYQELQRNFKSEKLRQILGFPAVFLGGSPFNTPSLYALLAWADFGKGVWYPMGGLKKLVNALATLATEYGVSLQTASEALSIEVQQGRVKAVHTATQRFEADIVIGAADLPFIETQLLSAEYRTWDSNYWQNKTMGISALLLYLGVKQKFRHVPHHTIYFSQDWHQNFAEIFDQSVLPSDPSLYISVRSTTDRSIVPAGHEEIVVLVPLGGNTSFSASQMKQFSQQVIAKVESVLHVDIQSHLVVKETYTPVDFSRDYHAFEGTALGLAHTFFQSLWFRPSNQSKKVKGLYYVGQYVQPGVGVPMALISAQMVAKEIGAGDNNQGIFKAGSTTYYYSSVFFRGQIKKDVFSLYAYVRVIDDLVDQEVPQLQEFEYLWQETEEAWRGGKSNSLIVRNFIELAKRRNFQWSWVTAFWEAMRNDVSKKQYASFSELEKYMHGSAEVIGLMMASILGLPDEAMHAAALQGKAMQYVNFIRDVREDVELGRNYLGFTETIASDPEQWQRFVHSCLEKYWALQQEAEKGYRFIPRRYLIPIKTAADMYNWTAQKIYRDPNVVWTEKIKPSKWRVIVQIVRNAVVL